MNVDFSLTIFKSDTVNSLYNVDEDRLCRDLNHTLDKSQFDSVKIVGYFNDSISPSLFIKGEECLIQYPYDPETNGFSFLARINYQAKISFSNTSLSDIHTSHLIKALYENKNIVEWDLSNNHLSSKSAQRIFHFLKTDSVIKNLNLLGAFVDSVAMNQLSEMISKNRKLEELSFSVAENSKSRVIWLNSLASALKENTKLKKLTLFFYRGDQENNFPLFNEQELQVFFTLLGPCASKVKISLEAVANESGKAYLMNRN